MNDTEPIKRGSAMTDLTEASHFMNPLSSAYVASFGINPNNIPLHGWDATGYEICLGDKPINNSSDKERRAWPDGFDYARMLELWASDEPTRRGL